MHCDTTELFPDNLTLSCVDAGANVNAKFPYGLHNCSSTADRTRGTVKRREKAVPRGVDFATSMPRELATNKGVMLSEKVFPSSVAEFNKATRRLDNVREQDGGQYTVSLGLTFSAVAGQERFNLAED
jgi:hypothetical protein